MYEERGPGRVGGTSERGREQVHGGSHRKVCKEVRKSERARAGAGDSRSQSQFGLQSSAGAEVAHGHQGILLRGDRAQETSQGKEEHKGVWGSRQVE